MPVATPTPPQPAIAPVKAVADPEAYRMTLGQHIEDLRRRLIYALIGVAIVGVVCLIFGDRVVIAFCRPLIDGLRAANLNPQVYYTQISEVFMLYLKVSMISAAALSSPWVLYQLWLFVATGLYPAERKTVTKFIPLSVGLLLAGMAIVYFLVLPVTIEFLLKFSNDIPLPGQTLSHVVAATQPTPFTVPTLDGDPAAPLDQQLWFNAREGRLKFFRAGQVFVVQFGPQNLLSPMITVSDYIDLVTSSLIAFGLCFQLPIVVVALASVGIVNTAFLRKTRKPVWLILALLAAATAPGDLVTTMMMLFFPLVALYELGVVLAANVERRRARARV